MSHDRALMTCLRAIARENLHHPSYDNATMVAAAVEDVCQAFEDSLGRALRAERAIHTTVKDSEEVRG